MAEVTVMDRDQAAGNDRAQAPAMAGVNVGAVSIEIERAVAEVKGQIYLAKSFPRNLTQSHLELMESCRVYSFAEKAFYKKPQGRDAEGNQKHVVGESIRLAEEIARVVGNFDYGHRELSRSDGKSEVEVYAWDKEKNNRSTRQITVAHVIDTKHGPRVLRDQTDIDNKIANVASKQMRGRILALSPKWLIAEAVEECRKTLATGGGQSIQIRVRSMFERLAFYGVTVDHVETYVGKKTDAFTGDDLAELFGVYNAIKEGEPAVAYFGTDAQKEALIALEKPTVGPLPGQASEQPHPAATASGKRQAKARQEDLATKDKSPADAPASLPADPVQKATEQNPQAEPPAAKPDGKKFF